MIYDVFRKKERIQRPRWELVTVMTRKVTSEISMKREMRSFKIWRIYQSTEYAFVNVYIEHNLVRPYIYHNLVRPYTNHDLSRMVFLLRIHPLVFNNFGGCSNLGRGF